MYDYLTPLLRKKPELVVLHVSTNDCPNSSSEIVLNKLERLKEHIETSSSDIKVIISCPISRYDDNVLACLRVYHLQKKLRMINVDLLDNSNIVRKHVGRLGLHLNDHGTSRYAMNLISLIRRL